jgi:cytochrome P450 family 142 subfamily A polypeptide 1
MTDLEARPTINVLDPEFYVDPWSSYRWLRDEAPVFWDPMQRIWVISRYDDILTVERDGARYSSFQGSRPHLDQSSDESMINRDDPDHQAQRNLVSRGFTPRAVRNHEDHIRQIVTEILDSVVPLGECEAIEAIASRLPAMVICELLGYPLEMWERVRYWSERVMMLAGQTSPSGPPHVTPPEIIPVMEDWAEVTVALIEQRRGDPQDDLISHWVSEGWTTKHVLDETVLVLDGGAETTRTVIGSIIRELTLQPDGKPCSTVQSC